MRVAIISNGIVENVVEAETVEAITNLFPDKTLVGEDALPQILNIGEVFTPIDVEVIVIETTPPSLGA